MFCTLVRALKLFTNQSAQFGGLVINQSVQSGFIQLGLSGHKLLAATSAHCNACLRGKISTFETLRLKLLVGHGNECLRWKFVGV